MQHRSHLPARERELRSRLAQLVHEKGLLRANLVQMTRQCGKAGCRCQRGEGHTSLYVAQSCEGKKRMSYVPKTWETEVSQWTKNYQEVRALLEELSERSWEKLRRRQR